MRDIPSSNGGGGGGGRGGRGVGLPAKWRGGGNPFGEVLMIAADYALRLTLKMGEDVQSLADTVIGNERVLAEKIEAHRETVQTLIEHIVVLQDRLGKSEAAQAASIGALNARIEALEASGRRDVAPLKDTDR
jgi:hypothetical protein